MRICNRHAAAHHIYTNIITSSLCFTEQQLNDNFEINQQKNPEKRSTLIPRCVVYTGIRCNTPRPKCTNGSLNLFGYVVVVVAVVCPYIFLKAFFFLCCVPLMIIIWNKILDEYFMRALNSAPCNQKCALVFHPFAFIVVIISLLSSGPVAFISVRLPYTFSCSSFFFLCCDHFLCIFTL